MFLDQNLRPVFEKVSSPVRLSDNPDKWQMEVSTQVYRLVPYLADYAVNVIFDKVDAQRGAALGRAEVTPKSEAATAEERDGLPHAVIPLVVTDRLLQPLDIFLDGKGAYPLSEWRLREQLMRTSAFETSNRKPIDQGMVDSLYPPMRTNYGYGHGSVSGADMGGFGKMAHLLTPEDLARVDQLKAQGVSESVILEQLLGQEKVAEFITLEHLRSLPRAKPPLLETIAPTIPPVEAEQFVDQFKKDPELSMMAARDPDFQKLAFIVASAHGHGVEKTASTLVDAIKPTVVQLTKLANGNFRVRYANREAFLVKEAQVPPEQAAQVAGSDKVIDMKPDSTVTVSTDRAKKTSLISEKVEVVRDFGQYRCAAVPGNEQVVGWVLPVMDFEMQLLPLYLFVGTEPGTYSLQDDIAGSRVGHSLQLPQEQPQGNGAFYFVDNERATALLPVTINHTMTMPDGTVAYSCEGAFGEPIELHPSPGLTAIQPMEEGKYAIPDTLLWVPLTMPMHLAKDPQEIQAVEAGQQAPSTVGITPTGAGEVSLAGAPLEKVASAERTFIDHSKAEFLLVAMGANPFEVREKLAHAHRYGSASMSGLHPITTLADFHSQAVKQAAALLADVPYDLRANLVKEAAALGDSESADKILSLNFLNAENLSTFVGYLPELNETASKLSEMLLAARLGQRQIPQEAIEKCLKHLDIVIMGIRALKQRGGEA
jgi:hypothetical protein